MQQDLSQTANSSANLPQQSSKRKLYQVAYIFMILFTVMVAIAIIPLAWMIPMTIACKNCRNEVGTPREIPHIGLGICMLIFAGIIPGILVLVASGSE